MQRFEDKYDLLNAAYKDSALKKGTIALLQYLVHKSNKEQCFPAVDTIAKALGVCRRTVQYNMRKLEKAGYIIRKDRYYNHLQMTNQYVFNFGITEDIQGEMIYSDQEYEMLNSFFNIPEHAVCKINEIQKIYNMDLTSREKLLAIYLYHRANKRGVVYDKIQVFMSAVGVKSWTLQRLLTSLREKGLIKIIKTVLRGQVYFVIQLTGNVYYAAEQDRAEAVDAASMTDVQKESVETADDEVEIMAENNIQKRHCDQNQEIENIVQNIQKGIVKHRGRRVKRTQFRNFISLLQNRFGRILKKIKQILRL